MNSNLGVIAGFFFATVFFVSITADRYATLASLLRKTREDLSHGKESTAILSNGKSFIYHVNTYKHRLYLLAIANIFGILSAFLMVTSVLAALENFSNWSYQLFVISMVSLMISIIAYIAETIMSLGALQSHLHAIYELMHKNKKINKLKR